MLNNRASLQGERNIINSQNKVTNSMETSQQVTLLLRNPIDHYCAQRSQLIASFLNQINSSFKIIIALSSNLGLGLQVILF
jgi:hypothetical protein